MKYVCLVLASLLMAGCAPREPLMHPLATYSYDVKERKELMDKLAGLLRAGGISIAKFDVRGGTIVSDSFDVLPQYCDCGKNLLGAEYPGQRRGVMRVNVASGTPAKVTIDLKTKLLIRANQKTVICTSYGVLEDSLFRALEKELGAVETGRRN